MKRRSNQFKKCVRCKKKFYRLFYNGRILSNTVWSKQRFCNRQCYTLWRSGSNHWRWKDGRTLNCIHGYFLVRSPLGNQFREHRVVMECFIGRKLSRTEHIHHINGNKVDNRIENLIRLSPHDHANLHKDKLTGKFKHV